jgi:hypothetical protein
VVESWWHWKRLTLRVLLRRRRIRYTKSLSNCVYHSTVGLHSTHRSFLFHFHNIVLHYLHLHLLANHPAHFFIFLPNLATHGPNSPFPWHLPVFGTGSSRSPHYPHLSNYPPALLVKHCEDHNAGTAAVSVCERLRFDVFSALLSIGVVEDEVDRGGVGRLVRCAGVVGHGRCCLGWVEWIRSVLIEAVRLLS